MVRYGALSNGIEYSWGDYGTGADDGAAGGGWLGFWTLFYLAVILICDVGEVGFVIGIGTGFGVGVGAGVGSEMWLIGLCTLGYGTPVGTGVGTGVGSEGLGSEGVSGWGWFYCSVEI